MGRTGVSTCFHAAINLTTAVNDSNIQSTSDLCNHNVESFYLHFKVLSLIKGYVSPGIIWCLIETRSGNELRQTGAQRVRCAHSANGGPLGWLLCVVDSGPGSLAVRPVPAQEPTACDGMRFIHTAAARLQLANEPVARVHPRWLGSTPAQRLVNAWSKEGRARAWRACAHAQGFLASDYDAPKA